MQSREEMRHMEALELRNNELEQENERLRQELDAVRAELEEGRRRRRVAPSLQQTITEAPATLEATVSDESAAPVAQEEEAAAAAEDVVEATTVCKALFDKCRRGNARSAAQTT